MIGQDAAACAYARSQEKIAESIGIDYKLHTLSQDVSQQQLIDCVEKLNRNPDVHGIMIHKPVPQQINYRMVANCVDLNKDLEGINVANIGKMTLGETRLIPCTPAAVMALLQSTQIPLRGKEVVIVGHSEIVGKPLSLLFLKEHATVTICHVATSEAGKLIDHVARAEILVVAVGKPGLIKGSWIKKKSIIIDVGINQVGDKIVGDVEFLEAQQNASFITPVPGGVGPVTVVMLMQNGVEAMGLQIGKVLR